VLPRTCSATRNYNTFWLIFGGNAGDQKQFHAGDQKQFERAELCAASVTGRHLCAAPSFPFDDLCRIQAKAVAAVLRPVQCPD
jgi:hypothetical protein